MNYVADNPTYTSSGSERMVFLRKTYSLLGASILGVAILEILFIRMGWGEASLGILAKSRFGWLIVLGAFMGVSYIAQKWAATGASIGKQYMGLGLYVVAESLILLPLITMATFYKPGAIGEALFFTGIIVGALTFAAFTMKTDFSFMGGFLRIAMFVALGVIVASILFGFSLGVLFAGIMCLLMGASVLYTTSTIIHHYPSNMAVSAALALLAGIATLFWYVLQLVMSRD